MILLFYLCVSCIIQVWVQYTCSMIILSWFMIFLSKICPMYVLKTKMISIKILLYHHHPSHNIFFFCYLSLTFFNAWVVLYFFVKVSRNTCKYVMNGVECACRLCVCCAFIRVVLPEGQLFFRTTFPKSPAKKNLTFRCATSSSHHASASKSSLRQSNCVRSWSKMIISS